MLLKADRSTHVGVALSVDELELLSLLLEEWELRQDETPSEVILTVRTLRAGLEDARNKGLETHRKVLEEGVKFNRGTILDMLRGRS